MGNSKFQRGLGGSVNLRKHPFIILAMSYFSGVFSPTLNIFTGFLKVHINKNASYT